MKAVIFIICGLVLACTSALYKPGPEHAARAGVKLEALDLGRKYYVDHCGSCHQLHLPAEYSIEKWKLELDSMQHRAHLSTEQKEMIFTFIKAGK